MENQIEKNLTHVHALLAKGEFMEAMETYTNLVFKCCIKN